MTASASRACRTRIGRATLVPVVVLSLVALWPAPPASAWSNGVAGPNSYGTHDWLLDRALSALGETASWVCRRTALQATDDPDTKEGLDHASGTWWHVYDIWGSTWGNAPEAVAVWFHTASRLHARGKDCAASRAIGIMAHLVGDVAQPMHTDGSLDAENAVHEPYEEDVDSRSRSADSIYRFTYDGRGLVTPYAATVRLAKLAHGSYVTLVSSYDADGYSETVDRITRRALNRGANTLADLIAAMSSDGEPRATPA